MLCDKKPNWRVDQMKQLDFLKINDKPTQRIAAALDPNVSTSPLPEANTRPRRNRPKRDFSSFASTVRVGKIY